MLNTRIGRFRTLHHHNTPRYLAVEAREPKFWGQVYPPSPHCALCLQFSKCFLFFSFTDIAVAIMVDVEEVEAAVAQAERVHCLLVLGPGEGPVLAGCVGCDRLCEGQNSRMQWRRCEVDCRQPCPAGACNYPVPDTYQLPIC
jgi:hypothetical protein|uniref:Uncharacterized protein n=1 Tax=Zea mays TaxID=4577 RepID=A0A804RB66_MAIZE